MNMFKAIMGPTILAIGGLWFFKAVESLVGATRFLTCFAVVDCILLGVSLLGATLLKESRGHLLALASIIWFASLPTMSGICVGTLLPEAKFTQSLMGALALIGNIVAISACVGWCLLRPKQASETPH
jgi:hypothetical protein